MTDPVTANIGLAQPTRGSDTGVWDTPMNNNTTLLDLCVGGIATIGLNNANVVLSANQFQSEEIVFNSTLTGSVQITFPTSFIKSYVIQHACTGSSAFTITLATTAGGQVIAIPPGETIECRNDGSNLRFKSFGRIGEYYDHCGSSVPNWIPACTVPPYLNCDGTTFSSATYPVLANYLGGTTLPDLRGRVRGYLNQGTGRMTSGGGGVDGNTMTAAGGVETITLQTSQMPSHTHGTSDPGHSHTYTAASGGGQYGGNIIGPVTQNTGQSVTGLTVLSAGGGGSHINMQPTAIGGITMIRAG